jgi:methionyl-tRNA formyltransferase
MLRCCRGGGGAAPVQRAILAGDTQTGVSIMQMDAGLDSGPVLMSVVVPIAGDDNASVLHDRLAATGARLVIDVLAQLPLTAQPQPEGGITYAAKIDKREAALDWRLPAEQLARQVRAFDPVPGATCVIEGQAAQGLARADRCWRGSSRDGPGG